MKRILFLLLFVCSFASAQVHKLEAIGLDTLTTAERDAITVPGDRAYIIYNETTGQFEYSAKGGAWQVLGGGGGGLTDMNWSDPIDANLLPDADGTRNLGSSAFSFGDGWFDGTLTVGGSEVVTAASAFGTDNALIRSDGTGKGVQGSLWFLSDTGDMTFTADRVYDLGTDGFMLDNVYSEAFRAVLYESASDITESGMGGNRTQRVSNTGGTFWNNAVGGLSETDLSYYYKHAEDTWGWQSAANIRIEGLGGNGTGLVAVDNSGNLSYATNFGATALQNIVEDTTPQLGGTLDMNGQSVFGDIVPISDSAADLGSPTRAFWEANIDNLMLRPQGSSVKGWEVRSQTTGDDIVFLAETGAGTNLYTSVIYKLNDSGTPTDATDLVTKGYADANYGSGSGDVVGPASATDNAIARFDTTTGKLLQDSGVTITDAGVITAPSGFSLGSGTTTAIFAGNDLKFQRTDGFSYISQTGSNDLYFNTDNAAGTTTPIMALEGGTNTPFVKPFFSIYVNDGNGNNQGASISRNMTDYALNANAANTTSNYKGVIGVGETTSTVAAGISSFDDGTGAALGLSLFTGNNAAVAEAIRINSSQDVSIPNGDLSVTGNITVTGTVDGVDISALTGTDVALADAGAYFTTDNVEAATQELAADVAGKVDGTIPTRTSVTAVTEIGTQTMANYLSDGVPSAGQWVGISDATPEYLTTSATFNFALLDEYNYDDSATDAATITFSNMGEGHKVRIKYNRASAPTYSGETPTQLPNTFSAGSWPANDDVEAVYYKRFGTVYYFFKEL